MLITSADCSTNGIGSGMGNGLDAMTAGVGVMPGPVAGLSGRGIGLGVNVWVGVEVWVGVGVIVGVGVLVGVDVWVGV